MGDDVSLWKKKKKKRLNVEEKRDWNNRAVKKIDELINNAGKIWFGNRSIFECIRKRKASYFFIMFSLNERKERNFCLQIYKRFITVCNPMVKGIFTLVYFTFLSLIIPPMFFFVILIVFFPFFFFLFRLIRTHVCNGIVSLSTLKSNALNLLTLVPQMLAFNYSSRYLLLSFSFFLSNKIPLK